MSKRAAIRYAKAIMERAQANGLAAQTNDDMLLIADTIKSNAELNNFVKNPVFSRDVKYSALLEVFSQIGSESKLLLKLLAENKRLEILADVASAYNGLFDKVSGIEKIQVTTAFPITPELEAKVIAKVKEFTSNSLVIENIVDESIIGGFILRMGDKQYNASVANKLTTLKRELTN